MRRAIAELQRYDRSAPAEEETSLYRLLLLLYIYISIITHVDRLGDDAARAQRREARE